MAFTRSSANASWTYIGCSDQSVPSLSNAAIRSGGGTKSGEPGLVTRSTKFDDGGLGPALVPGRKRAGSRRAGLRERAARSDTGGDQSGCYCRRLRPGYGGG